MASNHISFDDIPLIMTVEDLMHILQVDATLPTN